MLAVGQAKNAVIKLLLDLGANVNIQREEDGQTALMMATRTGSIIQSLLLFEHGGNNLDLKDKSGKTALDHLNRKLESLKSTSLSYRENAETNPFYASLVKKADDEYNQLNAAVAKALEARASQSESQI